MSKWGKSDQSVTANSTTTIETTSGAPIGTFALVKGSGNGSNVISMSTNSHFGNTSPGSRAFVDVNLYGNTTVGAFIPNQAVGVFAINSTMMGTGGGGIELGKVVISGSGYAANAAVTLTVVNGGSGASANATAAGGRITTLNANQTGTGFIVSPSVVIAAPAAINLSANSTGVGANVILVSTANSLFLPGDSLFYTVPTSNTAIPGLTGNSTYYVTFSNTTAIALSGSSGGANLVISANGTTTETHTIRGQTATGYFDVASAFPQVSHAGWVLRREGTGGRAGRVTYETLVAMSSTGANTSSNTGVFGPSNTVTSNTTVDALV